MTPELPKLLRAAKVLARKYRALTGRALGVTGEIGECEACRLLGLELSPVRRAGFDAVRIRGGKRQRLQIKARCLSPGRSSAQRLGRLDLTKSWDAVLLVLLDEAFEATAIYEATRPAVVAALRRPGSKARNDRGALSVKGFMSLGRRIWPVAP